MDLKDILIIVKTYPVISRSYTETVCTAGILADTKKLIRLYPIRFRYLEGESRFSKYQWIKAEISKAPDSRPESYNIVESTIQLGDTIPPDTDWWERRKWILTENNVFGSMKKLHNAQQEKGTSLGLIKPAKVTGLSFENIKMAEIETAIKKKNSVISQLDLFEEMKDLYLLPIKIVLKFYCHEAGCKGHKMSILDWEIGQLYRKVKNRPDWKEKMKKKILGEIFDEKREAYLILGNMAKHQQTFCILGFFWPPKQHQMRLF